MKRILFYPFLLFVAAAAHAGHYTQREDVGAFISEMHERHGFSEKSLRTLFAKSKHIDAVIAAIMPPRDPSIRSWQTYQKRFIEPRRIAAGLRFARENAAALAKAERQYGVPADIILAIIGVETIYGRNMGRFTTFDALTTLAFDYPPRAALFRSELEALLLLARDEKRNPYSYKGSFAGALGLPQFLPSSKRLWAVDFDGDGHIDLATSPTDAIGSVANFLKEHGWTTGGPVACPARAVGNVSALVHAGIKPQRLPAEMPEVAADAPPPEPAALIELITPDAPNEYWLGYNNFFVLTRYNRSSFYAMSVYQLAEAIKAAR